MKGTTNIERPTSNVEGVGLKFLSVCSGIEAASVAWEPLGWQAVAFCEFDKFPSAVLAHHWPRVPNLGDMTQWREWPEEILNEADILAGGTPCQAFSIAGLRNSLADERGNLTLTYVHLLNHIDTIRARHGRPAAVCVWENVPGVLNTDDNAFGCFLAALAGEELPLQPPGGRWSDAGYVRGPRRTIAWRSLDAQYFGLAQRRQRVFVVASAREGFCPEEVLFEREGVRRDSPPSRSAGEGSTRGFETGPCGGSLTDLYPTLDTRCKDGPIRNQLGGGVIESICMATGQAGAEIGIGIGIGTTLNCNHEAPIVTQEIIGSLCADSHPGSYTGQDAYTGRLIPEISKDLPCGLEGDITRTLSARHDSSPCADRGMDVIAVNTGQGYWNEHPAAGTLGTEARAVHENNLICVHGTQDPCCDDSLAFALGRNSGQENAVAFAQNTRDEVREMPIAGALASQPGMKQTSYVRQHMAVRRLIPVECARLQGFPDNHTQIPTWNGWRKLDPSETPEQLAAEGLEVRQNKKTGKWRVKEVDGPQYKAYGNSMAVPVMRWIGSRLKAYLKGGAA